MRKVDSDRIQSFHMQALRRILGIRWYDKVSNAVVNERTKREFAAQESDSNRRMCCFNVLI